MRLTPEAAVTELLAQVGLTPEELFADVPKRYRRDLTLPAGLSDRDVEESIRAELSRNVPMHERPALLGGGCYAHDVPAETRYLATRGEFLTAYTPYQPEINQGLLQALFEFQTLSARLLELDVANTGVYDGASGAGEACLVALRASKARTVLVPEHVPRQRLSILKNYVLGAGGTVETVPTDEGRGTIDLGALEHRLDDGVACVHLENPNVYGCLEPVREVAALTDEHGALTTCLVPEITSLGLVHGPGALGAAVAAAEGQSLALPPSFGGPSLGLLSAREDLLRRMPGRIVGQASDASERTAYCLTLQTREQHIRRARATSNICTNQSMLAVLFSCSLASLGASGWRELAATNERRARDLRERLEAAGATVRHAVTPHYNEFLFDPPGSPAAFLEACRERHVEPGIPATRLLGAGYGGLIACVTELTPEWALGAVVAACEEVAR